MLPTWILAGLADWRCHRRSDIEHTAGTHEALIHAAMMGEAGVPVLLGLFVEVNAGVLAMVLGALGLHQATAAWDVAYAESHREVTAIEQHIHGVLEQAPAMAAATLMTLHWDQARALLPGTRDRPQFALQPKRRPLSRLAQAVIIVSIVLLGVVPYTEEVLRCRKVSRSALPQPKDGPR
ncbi:MAG TPA: hypothetical protein VGG41_04645 [Solirubrobacteraceae bacterium]